MYPTKHIILRGFALLLLAVGIIACDTVEDLDGLGLGEEDGQEVVGAIEALGDATITVEAIEYLITASTEFEGIDGLASLAVGTVVVIGFEEQENGRTALFIALEDGDDDDNDSGDDDNDDDGDDDNSGDNGDD
ncbi:MAG: DUF5666 domain-containing protein [Bacteroidota bacterium]